MTKSVEPFGRAHQMSSDGGILLIWGWKNGHFEHFLGKKLIFFCGTPVSTPKVVIFSPHLEKSVDGSNSGTTFPKISAFFI